MGTPALLAALLLVAIGGWGVASSDVGAVRVGAIAIGCGLALLAIHVFVTKE